MDFSAGSIRDEIQIHGACILRGFLDAELRELAAEIQRDIDRWVEEAAAGKDSPAKGCLAGRYTLTPNDIGPERYEAIVARACDAAADMACGPARRTMYGGAFVSSPLLPCNQDFHWHTDGHFDGNLNGVTIWTPLTDCGKDAPGLAFLDAPLSTSLGSLPTTEFADGYTNIDWISVTDKMVGALGLITIPTLGLGDVLVFSDSTLHRTQHTADMMKGRAALIARYAPHAITTPVMPA